MEDQAIEVKIDKSNFWRNEGLYGSIGFLIWPFGIAMEAFRQWRRPWSKNIFWLFCVFFGFTFIIDEEGGSDSDRYAQEFVAVAHSDVSFSELLNTFYDSDSDNIDIVSPLITYLVSRISDNPSVLFSVFGLLFGFFYSRNVWYVLERIDGKLTGNVILFILTFVLLNPIWYINSFRFYFAAQILLFGALPYLLEGRKRSLIWCGFTILVHFSFLFPTAILGVFLITKNRLNIYLVFFIITSFINEINLEWVQSTLSFLPDLFFAKVLTYADPDYAESRGRIVEELPWFITYSRIGLKWINYVIVLSVFLIGKKMLLERKDLTTLLCFSLLLFGFANIFSLIPSGSRFITVANTFMFPFFIMFFTAFPKIGNLFFIKVFSTPLLILFCLLAIRIGMDHFSAMTILGNPISVALYSDPIPLISEIKRIF